MSPSKPTRVPKPKKPAAKAKSVERAPSVAGTDAVETVRIIPAAAADETPAVELTAADTARTTAALKLAAEIDKALAGGQEAVLDPRAVQNLLAALARTYSAHVDAGAAYDVFSRANPVTATDVMVTSSAMLKSANVAVFELGMWQSWTGR